MERDLDGDVYDWRGSPGMCLAENLCFDGENEVEVICDEESGHADDHVDNERGFSWPRAKGTR